VSEGRRFVFLDRDGTLIRDAGYVHRPEDYALLDGVIEGLQALARADFALAIVTNQSGIARGYFSEAQFHAFHALLLADLRRADLTIEATYHCPHGPEDGCECRKPATGMLQRARRELGADLERSWVIGDSQVDVDLAARAGCRSVRIAQSGAPGDAALHARDLRAAAAAILAVDPIRGDEDRVHRPRDRIQ
jgi:histidinol-phosphate phosphatase family protein